MRARAIAGGAVIQLARILLGERDQLLQVLGGKIVLHDERMREGASARERGEIGNRIIARLLHQQHVVAVGLVVAEGDGVAIRLRLRHGARADGTGRTGAIFHDHLLLQVVLDRRADDAGDHIRRPACGIGHHEVMVREGKPDCARATNGNATAAPAIASVWRRLIMNSLPEPVVGGKPIEKSDPDRLFAPFGLDGPWQET